MGAVPDTLPLDSAQINAQARVAQRRFEDFHRSRLHQVLDSRGGRCDERVGRICLHFDIETAWAPDPEDPAIAEARETLLDSLEVLSVLIPADLWILGQRVRYLGHLGRWSEAGALAEECTGGVPWWCPALQGYVHHRSGRFVEASLAFQDALSLMPRELAWEWNDPAPLLDYSAGQWLKDPPGMTVVEARARFWQMADPLLLTPGNEGLTEHYSRHLAATFFNDAATTLDVRWGSGPEDLLLRYGFVAAWEKTAPSAGNSGGGAVIKHFHPESRGLLPPFTALEDPAGLPENAWVSTESARSTSAPVLSPLLVDGVGQTTVLRRGDDLLVVAAYDVPEDTVLSIRRPMGNGEERAFPAGPPPLAWEPGTAGAAQDTLAGLFLMADTGAWAPIGVMGTGGTGILQLRAPPGRYLLSLEQWNPAGRWGARVRHGIRVEAVPPDVPTLSELLLMEPGPELPQGLAEAIPRMMTSTVVRGDQIVTVGWEVYGLGLRREAITFRLSLLSEEGSFIRRAFKRIGLFRRDPDLTLSWTEGGPEDLGPVFRAVDLQLSALDSGQYVLRLEMDIPYRGRVEANRRITIR